MSLSGVEYEGEWKDDKPHGKGKEKCPETDPFGHYTTFGSSFVSTQRGSHYSRSVKTTQSQTDRTPATLQFVRFVCKLMGLTRGTKLIH